MKIFILLVTLYLLCFLGLLTIVGGEWAKYSLCKKTGALLGLLVGSFVFGLGGALIYAWIV